MSASDSEEHRRASSGLVRHLRAGFARLGDSVIRGERIWIMRGDLALRDAEPTTDVIEHEALCPEIWALYESRGGGFDRAQLERRFELGLRLFSLRSGSVAPAAARPQEDEIVATTWILSQGERYLDEVGWSVALEDDEIWVRDIYVRPEFRGLGLFARLLDAVRQAHFPDRRRIVSDIDPRNRASLRAHEQYGFRTAESFWALRIFGTHLIRHRRKSTPGRSSYLAGRSIIRMDDDFLRHQACHTA